MASRQDLLKLVTFAINSEESGFLVALIADPQQAIDSIAMTDAYDQGPMVLHPLQVNGVQGAATDLMQARTYDMEKVDARRWANGYVSLDEGDPGDQGGGGRPSMS